MKEHECSQFAMQGCREANWPGRRCVNTLRDVHWYVELACMGWCEHVWTCVGWPSVHGSPYHGRRVKAAGGLPVKVGTTRLSCEVGGWDEQPLVTTRLAMER
ncbi:hypothetical protein CRG98_008697 [Punica granatum]|uniref:Uncharacterized protein n=1 Tax=Punica granatum TaxID=22663 RepID=A0A2I0KQZ2_PUNGR|nr:hypothetical protein CRG98_008697 [Punica granatum]